MSGRIENRLPFEGSGNVRELGGYEAADGRHVKHGVFYRGIALAELKSEKDQQLLRSLGIKMVLDFRSEGEARWYGPDPEVPGVRMVRISAINTPVGEEIDFSPEGVVDMEQRFRKMGIDIEEWFDRMYADMPFANPAYQFLFRELEAGTVPVYYHCSAGKDRTGIASILILLALGVPRETALKDYMLTNDCNRERIEQVLKENAELLKRQPEKYEYLMRDYTVASKNAEDALNAMEERYGSYEAFFEAEFGLSAERLNHLRNLYLEIE